mmetsp:Transcript_14604/g.40180  ORF Transcript_14604/g.40180 Transcript_14604/m.40180 type:complete len:251 (-) Transcript_14604:758-1510(-)
MRSTIVNAHAVSSAALGDDAVLEIPERRQDADCCRAAPRAPADPRRTWLLPLRSCHSASAASAAFVFKRALRQFCTPRLRPLKGPRVNNVTWRQSRRPRRGMAVAPQARRPAQILWSGVPGHHLQLHVWAQGLLSGRRSRPSHFGGRAPSGRALSPTGCRRAEGMRGDRGTRCRGTSTNEGDRCRQRLRSPFSRGCCRGRLMRRPKLCVCANEKVWDAARSIHLAAGSGGGRGRRGDVPVASGHPQRACQ